MRLSTGSAEPSGEANIEANINSILNIASNVSNFNSTLLNIHSTVFKIAILLLFILFLAPSVSAEGYTLEEATTNITIDPSGAVHVEDAVSYTFERNYTYVYRIINVSTGESIRNIEGHCSDNACKFRVETVPEGYKLIGELPESTPRDLTFFISYDHYGAVKVHNDVSEFHRLWGEEWEKPLGSLKGSITFPVKNESEIRYWTHPPVYTQEENVEHNVLNLRTKEIPPSHLYEIRAFFPRIESPNSSFVQVDDKERLEEILHIESEYQRKGLILEDLYRMTGYFLLFALAFPFFIYFIYGREQKTDNEEKYTRKLPANFPANLFAVSRPAVVNAIMKGRMGIPTMDGFTATFMDLANRGYISLQDLIPEETDLSFTPESEPADFLIELNHEVYSKTRGNLSDLEDFEEDMIYLLKDHTPGRQVSWRKLREELEGGINFYLFLIAWNKKVKAHTEIDRFFQSKGNTYINWFSRGILIAAIIYYFAISGYFPSAEFPQVSKINFLTALVGILGFGMMKSSGMLLYTFGHWTPEGDLYYEHWDNFKEYITDISALKECPPESIKAWDSYLVYAASLGVTKQAFQNMSLVVPPEQLKESCLLPISYYYNQLDNGSRKACSPSCPGKDEGSDRGDGSGKSQEGVE